MYVGDLGLRFRDENMHTLIDFENKVRYYLKNFTYKPGWAFDVDFEKLRQQIPDSFYSDESLFLVPITIRFPTVELYNGWKHNRGENRILAVQCKLAFPKVTEEYFLLSLLKEIVSIEEHEVKEFFRYKGKAVETPHPVSQFAFGKDIIGTYLMKKIEDRRYV